MRAPIYRVLSLSWLCLLPLSACNCEDEVDSKNPWELADPLNDKQDLGPDLATDQAPDLAPDLGQDMPEDLGPDLAEDMAPDMPLIEDMAPDLPPDVPWEPEVVAEVPRTQALTDRTSLEVGDNNTVWLGYHECTDFNCSSPWLSVTHKTRGGRSWINERVARQEGTFGLDVYKDQPFVAYLDGLNSEFKVGYRGGADQWQRHALPVQFTGAFDGLDIAHDTNNVYVTFANSSGAPVSLFMLNMTRGPSNNWSRLQSLDVGKASAALERGLKADNNGNLFLVHRDGEFGPYGVARYRLRDNIWDRRVYFPDTSLIVSSMEARQNGDICLSSYDTAQNNKVTLTCGKVNRLERDQYTLERELTQEYNSLIEGRDGSLIIAYTYNNNERLKIARRYPNGTWDIRTVFEGPAYGVSTAIDRDNKLLLSYYTCRQDRCTLEFIRQPY